MMLYIRYTVAASSRPLLTPPLVAPAPPCISTHSPAGKGGSNDKDCGGARSDRMQLGSILADPDYLGAPSSPALSQELRVALLGARACCPHAQPRHPWERLALMPAQPSG